MVELVLRTAAFYFSYSYDLTHTFQRLQTSSPDFSSKLLIERADQRFVWNRYLLSSLVANKTTAQFALPLIHGCKSIPSGKNRDSCTSKYKRSTTGVQASTTGVRESTMEYKRVWLEYKRVRESHFFPLGQSQ